MHLICLLFGLMYVATWVVRALIVLPYVAVNAVFEGVEFFMRVCMGFYLGESAPWVRFPSWRWR